MTAAFSILSVLKMRPFFQKGCPNRETAQGIEGARSGHRSTALAVRGGRSNSGAPQSPVSGAKRRKCAQIKNPLFESDTGRDSLAAALVIDLQWFAAEDEGRTEEPSEYKIQKAREEGRVAKSQELIGALGLLLPALLLLFLGPSMLRTCVEMLRFFLTRATEMDPVEGRFVAGLFFRYFARLVLPLVIVAMLSGIISNLVQVGFIFTTKPITPDFTKILPRFGQYFQRTLFSVDGLFNFAKSIVKMGAIGLVAYLLITSDLEKLINLERASLWLGISTVASLAIKLLIISALLLLILSIPDYMFQRWRYRESLRMSREEVTEERKMYEGDPYVRSRIRSRMRQMMSRNMAVNVAKADVVITNPTHYAVALEYNKETMPAPQVTAKGEDEMALQIRRIARDNEVPVVENRPLARALYAELEVGDFIPKTYFTVVAGILRRIMGIDEERRRREAMGA